MHVAALKLKNGGKLRSVFMKEIMQQQKTMWTEEKWVAMSDTKAQQQLLKSGFIGISLKKAEETWLVQYVK